MLKGSVNLTEEALKCSTQYTFPRSNQKTAWQLERNSSIGKTEERAHRRERPMQHARRRGSRTQKILAAGN
jgi:hypothetical protein